MSGAANTSGVTWWRLLTLLLLGGVCVAFGQGRWPLALAAWLAPVLLIRFSRAAPVWFGVIGLTVVHAAGWEVAYLGMVKMPTAARWGLFLGLSLAMALVYQADRWVSTRNAGAWTTLVFPCGWVAFEYLNGRFSPSGSWASIAYTFAEHPVLVQVTSLVGWTGITFLVGWVASVINHAWSRGAAEEFPTRITAACAIAIAAALLFGGARLWATPASDTVRIANIVGPSPFMAGDEFQRNVWAYTRGLDLPETEVAAAQGQIQRTIDRYLALAAREIENGALVVLFPEANCALTSNEAPAFVESARSLANRHDAYVGLSLFVFRPDAGLPAENRFVLLGPDGETVLDYLKAKLVPGSTHVVGDGTLPIVETAFGTISCAICFDMDFPVLLQQAAAADIVFAPSNDWTEVRAIHARMAMMRAVEQGFTMVRPTKDGYALVTDALGRTVAWQDTDRPGEHVLVTEAPVDGVRTLYSVIGDTFSWACMLMFVAFLVAGKSSASAEEL